MAHFHYRRGDAAAAEADAKRQAGDAAANDSDGFQGCHCATNRCTDKSAGLSCKTQPCAIGQRRDNSCPAKPARMLTTASCRVTELQPSNQSRRQPKSDQAQRRGSMAANTVASFAAV